MEEQEDRLESVVRFHSLLVAVLKRELVIEMAGVGQTVMEEAAFDLPVVLDYVQDAQKQET